MPEEGGNLTNAENIPDTKSSSPESNLPQVNNDPHVQVIKSEDKLMYTVTSDMATSLAQAVIASQASMATTSIAGLTVDGSQLMPMMSLAGLHGVTLPMLQSAGFQIPMSNGGQTGIPMMIQGLGGTNALTIIYPAAMMSSAPITTTTTMTSADINTITSQSIPTPPGVITVVPQPESETLESPTELIFSGKETTVDLINKGISELASISNIHSAITNQIILGIKTESSLSGIDHIEETVTMHDSSLEKTSAHSSDADDSNQGSKAKRLKMSSLSKEDKICRVCGDKALGCNFDAISCESCKAFFRRNALKDKQPKCLFEGNCSIDVNTRRFCPFCRLQKCFTIGMKRELILGDTEKQKRNEKVKINRQKRQSKTNQPFQSPGGSAGPLTPGTPVSPGGDEDETLPLSREIPGTSNEVVIQHLESHSPKQEEPDHTSSGPSLVNNMGVTLGGMSFSMAGCSSFSNLPKPPPVPDVTNLLSLSKLAQKNEMASNVQIDTFLVRRLTAEENHMLQELMQVYDLSFTVDLEPLIHIKHLDPSLNQLVNQSSITVLRLIKFAKRLEEFIRLTQECQIGILKGIWIHILLLRSVSLYDSERDVWVTPKGDIPTEILKNATGFVKLHDDHVCYCKNIKAIIRDDLMIVVILLVIVLFSPEGPNVINRELVSNIQDKYLILLKHYLESKYTYVRAADMYPALMSKLKELKELAEIHGKYLLDVNPGEIEPIMLEILDLK